MKKPDAFSKGRSKMIASLEEKITRLEQRCLEAERALAILKQGATSSYLPETKNEALISPDQDAKTGQHYAQDDLQKINAALIAEITEHMQTEDALVESRRKYLDLIETTGEFIWEVDSQGRYTYCSPQMETLWGIKPQEMIGKTPFDVMPPSEKERGLKGFYEVARSASPFRDMLSTSYNGRGELIFIETSGNPYFDQNGNLAGYRGITRDITERTKTEEKLRDAYKELEQRVRERTHELLILNEDLKAEITERKRAEKEARTSAQLAEGLAQSIILLNSSLDLDQVLDAILVQVKLSVPYTIAAITQYKNDTVHLIRYTNLDSHPETAKVVEFIERLSQTPQLVEIRKTLQPISIEETRNDSQWINIPGAEWIRSYLAVPLVSGGQFEGAIHLTSDQPGAFKPEMLSCMKAFAASAAVAIQNALLYKDLQDALQHEQAMRLQLIQAEKLSALNRMLATVLHELNNPVQTIKNCIYITKVDLPADSPYLETLNIADGELNRIANLVSALREIYRQPKNISFESLSITKLLSEVHTLLNPHLQHLNIVWQQVQPVGPLEVNGIADHLKQVFLNICMNAIEAMQPGGGMLTIDARNDTQNNEVIVAITDTGGGIDPSDMEKIFEPFYTTKEGGSGLGLSICYEIVKKHAGRITTESQPGKGTTFTVSLPIKPGPEQAEEIVR